MRLLIFVFGLFFSVTILYSQQIELEPLGGPMGAEIDDFNLNSDGNILVFQKYAGFLFSDDSGQNWQNINSDFSGSIGEILPHPNGNFYITNNNEPNRIFLFDKQNSSINSIDIRSFGELEDLVISKSGIIYFLTEDRKIFNSTDNGNSWILTRELDGLSYSGGRRDWMSLSFSEESIYLIERISNDDWIVEIPLDGSPMDTIEAISPFINQIIEIASDSLLLATNNGLRLLDKNSTNFQFIGDRTWSISDMVTTIDENLIIETENGYFAINDLGANIIGMSIDFPLMSYSNTGRLVFDQSSNSIFLQNNNALNSNFIKYDIDILNVQQIIPSNQPLRIVEILKPYDNVVITNQSYSGYFISYDSANTFSPLLINGNGLFDLEIGGNGAFYALSDDEKIVYRSFDKGISWEDIQLPAALTNVNSSDSHLTAGHGDFIYCFLSGGLGSQFYSVDGGDNWLEITNGFFVQSFKDNVKIDMYGNIYHTDLAFGTVNKYNVQEENWELLYDGDDVFIWLGLKDSLSFIALSFRNGELFNLRTNNAFSTTILNKLSNEIQAQLPILNTNPYLVKNRFLFDFNFDRIILSQNDGLSWKELFMRDSVLFPKSINAIHVDKDDFLYVAFNGGVIHRSTTPLQFNTNSIQGKVQIDENDNCLNDPTEAGMPSVIVTAAGQDTFLVSTQTDGSFDILVPEGTYDIYATVDTPLWQVCTPLQAVSLSGTYDTAFVDFSVEAEIDCPKLEVDLTTPRLRRCFDNTYYVNYKNTGTIAADTPFVKITLDPRFNIKQATIPFSVQNDSCYIFPLDTIDVFEEGNFSFVTEMECDSVILGETICAEAHIFPDSICGVPSTNWSGASLESTAECIGDSIIFKIKNVGNGDMNQARQYIIIEDVVIMRISPSFNLPAGDSLRIPIEAIGQTYHLEVPQVDNHPGQSYPSVTVESCGQLPHSLGLFNQFSQNDNNPFIDIECREVVGSYDPNDKAAVPRGIDVEHKIQPNSTIEYLIRFQNTGTDTAFSVNIIDTLSQWLDVTSFTAGASSHPYEYEISDQGTVRFIFNNIMLPDSNINEPASNGFIKYKIAMKADLPIGTEILNKADIYFDFNAPIRTNETFHVIDEPWILVKTSEVFVPGVEVNAYPNPFQHQATIKLSNASNGQKKFRLFDLSGRQIRQQYFDSDQFIFEKQSLINGIYFYEISRAGTKIAVGKLIIQ